jgi:hypothetical protein
MEITKREYNRAQGLTPGGDGPSRAGQIRRRGRDLGAEIARDGAPSPTLSAEQPVYNTPDKNMLAAEAAAEAGTRRPRPPSYDPEAPAGAAAAGVHSSRPRGRRHTLGGDGDPSLKI